MDILPQGAVDEVIAILVLRIRSEDKGTPAGSSTTPTPTWPWPWAGPSLEALLRMEAPLPATATAWAEARALRESLRYRDRVKDDQWRVLSWLALLVHASTGLAGALGPAPEMGAPAAPIPPVWMVLTYLDEWVDEAGSPAARADRLAWIRDRFLGVTDDREPWPPGLEDDGPVLLEVWRTCERALPASRWSALLGHAEATIAHERAVLDDAAQDPLRRRLGAVVETLLMLRQAYLPEWDAAFFGYMGCGLALVDDLEDREVDRGSGQYNPFQGSTAHLDQIDLGSARRAIVHCIEGVCRTAPPTIASWGGWFASFVWSYLRARGVDLHEVDEKSTRVSA